MILSRLKKYGFIFIGFFGVAVFFNPIIFSERTFFFRDIHRFFYPMKFFLAEALQNRTLPFWCPDYFCGAPFLSDIQSGVFYPFSFLFALFSFPKALNGYILIHFLLGFFFFYRFIRTLGLSKNAAVLTALSYSFGGYMIASLNTLNNLSTQIWLPAVLWAFQLHRLGKSRTGVALATLFLCFAILGGEPQLYILICGVLIVFSGVSSKPGSACIKNIGWALLMIAASLVMSMVQLGPTYLDFRYSIRTGGLPFTDATQLSMNWAMVKHLLIPLIFRSDFATDPGIFHHFFPGKGEIPWLLTVYPGFLILPLAVFGAVTAGTRKRIFWLVLFSAGLVLSLGRNTPLYALFYSGFPFFRYPEKFMFISGFSLLVLAAYGHDAFARRRFLKGARVARVLFLLPALLFADLYLAHHNLNPTCETGFYRYMDPTIKPLTTDPGTFRIYVDPENGSYPALDTVQKTHIYWQTKLMPNLGVLFGLHHVNGKTGLELKYQYLMTEILLGDWRQKIPFLKLSNVKYIISTRLLDRLPELNNQVKKINPHLYRLDGQLPRAFLIGRLHPYRPGSSDHVIDGSFDPRISAVGPKSIAGKYNRIYFKPVDQIAYRSNHRIEIETSVEHPAVLVLSETFYPGWRVFVDGREKRLYRMNLLFQGVEVEPGDHRIEFAYQPPHFKRYAAISIAACVVFAGIWIFWFVYEGRKSSINKRSGRQ